MEKINIIQKDHYNENMLGFLLKASKEDDITTIQQVLSKGVILILKATTIERLYISLVQKAI